MEQNLCTTSLNRVEIVGRVGAVRVSEVGGRKIIRLSVATNYAYRLDDGTVIEDTTWHTIEGWESDTIPTDIAKGDKVSVIGRLRNRRYINAEGEEMTTIDIAAESIVKDSAIPESSVYVICSIGLHHDASYYEPVRSFVSLEKAKEELARIAHEVKRDIDNGEDFGGEFKDCTLTFREDGEIATIETPDGYYERWEIVKTPLSE